jgi:hypothetical protein
VLADPHRLLTRAPSLQLLNTEQTTELRYTECSIERQVDFRHSHEREMGPHLGAQLTQNRKGYGAKLRIWWDFTESAVLALLS